MRYQDACTLFKCTCLQGPTEAAVLVGTTTHRCRRNLGIEVFPCQGTLPSSVRRLSGQFRVMTASSKCLYSSWFNFSLHALFTSFDTHVDFTYTELYTYSGTTYIWPTYIHIQDTRHFCYLQKWPCVPPFLLLFSQKILSYFPSLWAHVYFQIIIRIS